MRELPLEKAFMLIEPGNVAMVSTANKGKKNLMTMSWHMVMDFTPRFACLIGPWDFTYDALVDTKECVLAIPPVSIIEKVIGVGNCSGRDVESKFEKFGLTPLKARHVKAPLVKECLYNIECRVVDHIKKHDIFVLDAVAAWRNPSCKERRGFHAVGNGLFIADGEKLDMRNLMTRFPEVTRL